MTSFEDWQDREKVSLPINPKDIPNFKGWVNWYDFRNDKHDGFDFAAYFTQEDSIVLDEPSTWVALYELEGSLFEGVVSWNDAILLN